MEKTTIYFDMDGTLAATFFIKDFSKKVSNGDVSPYIEARPLFNEEAMAQVIAKLIENGYSIGIISYVGKTYTKESRNAKKQWLAKHFPFATEIHIIQEYTSKYNVAKCKNGILVDDARKNLDAWKGCKTINAYRANLVKELSNLIN